MYGTATSVSLTLYRPVLLSGNIQVSYVFWHALDFDPLETEVSSELQPSTQV